MGGSAESSSPIAPAVTIAPTIRIRKAAGPSPTLKLSKLRPQWPQRGANFTQPANSVRWPQRGHLPAIAAASELRTGRYPSARVRRAPAAPDIDGGEEEQPYDVDEMPVPGGRLEAEMLLRSEVALVSAEQADAEEDGSDDHVEAMEAGRHEKGRAVDVAFEGEGRVGIFPGLDTGEGEAEQDRQPQAELQSFAVAMDQRMVRPGDRRSRTEQDQGVEQREAPGVQHFDALGRPLASNRVHRGREERAVEEGPEPGEEEHHLGRDEKDHPVAQMQLHHRRMIAGVRFADRVRPPIVHGDEHAEDAEREYDLPVRILVPPHDEAAEQGQAAESADDRPRIGLYQMVIMVLRSGHS